MFKSVSLLLSLFSVFPTFTDFSFNHTLKTIIVQQNVPELEKEGFIFQYTGCERLDSDRVKCNFVVLNKRQRRKLFIIAETTRIFDATGTESRALQVNLGVENSTNNVTYSRNIGEIIHFAANEISTNVPIKGSAIFRGPIQNPITLFDMDFNTFRIEFNTKVNARNLR